MSDHAKDWLILSLKWSKCGSDHLVWYKPNSNGYTTDLDKAGRYTEDEASHAGCHHEGVTAMVRVVDAYAIAERPVFVEAGQVNVETLLAGAAAIRKGDPP